MMAILVSLLISGKSGIVTDYNYSITTNGNVMGFVGVSELPTEFKDNENVYRVVTIGNDKYMYRVYEHGIEVAWGTEKGESHNNFLQGGDYSIKG